MNNKKILCIIFFLSLFFHLSANEFSTKYLQTSNFIFQYQQENTINPQYRNINQINLTFNQLFKVEKQLYSLKKSENLVRRAEILFFGSLTFVVFGGWFFFSIYNLLIYDENFGTIRREQFLPLYLGSSIISISVVVSDLFIHLKPKMKNIEVY